MSRRQVFRANPPAESADEKARKRLANKKAALGALEQMRKLIEDAPIDEDPGAADVWQGWLKGDKFRTTLCFTFARPDEKAVALQKQAAAAKALREAEAELEELARQDALAAEQRAAVGAGDQSDGAGDQSDAE